MMSATALLARQGIYDSESQISAYEVLYRCDETRALANDSPEENDKASASVISQLFFNMDFVNILNNKPAFINFTKNHILQKIPESLPKKRVVIELLEHIEVDSDIIENVKSLHDKKYKIALDDFIFSESWAPLLDYADIIKLDVLNLDEKAIREAVEPLRGFKGQLLAEKIEDIQTFNICRDLGFTLFQGYYLDKPNLIKTSALSQDKTQLIRLINQLNDPATTIDEVEDSLLMQPKLSYRILRLTNSVAFYTGRKYETLLEAIAHLGLSQITNWASLLLLAVMDEVNDDLLERTLIRAKCCELLASNFPNIVPNRAFTIGLFSTLDAMFNQPLSELLQTIQLTEEMTNALLHETGKLGQLLQIVKNLEKGKFDELSTSGIKIDVLSKCYIDSIHFAREALLELGIRKI
jgi:c-di-GMP-related signal transduction protein